MQSGFFKTSCRIQRRFGLFGSVFFFIIFDGHSRVETLHAAWKKVRDWFQHLQTIEVQFLVSFVMKNADQAPDPDRYC
jgi:hypothetical protein